MKRFLVSLAVLAALGSLFAQNQTGISGVVVDAQTGNPIARAMVHTMGGQACTDPTGFYLIPHLRPGGYVVAAEAPGYDPAVFPDTVQVVEGRVTPDINFRLQAHGGGGQPGGISGCVVDAGTSNPIPFAWVYIRQMSTRTDSSGLYLLDHLRPGRYIVGACAEGYEPAVYPETVMVEPGQVTPNINFSLEHRRGGQNGGIAGVVTDADNRQLIRGALVTASNGTVSREVTQSRHGYCFRDLPAGKYAVSATAEGYDPGSYPDSVEVVAGRTTGHIDFMLARSGGGQNGGITGHVTDASTGDPLFGACVMARGPAMGRANSDSSGLYSIANLPAGTYEVVAAARGFQRAAPETVEVVAGQVTENVDFALQPMAPPGAGAIAGVVTDSATGLGVCHAQLFAWGATGQGFACTDSSGNYLVRRLRAGAYIVRAWARGYAPATWPDSVMVTEGETTLAINFVLAPVGHPQAGIAGFVYNGVDQVELAGAQVTAVGPSGTYDTRTDSRGEYLFDALEPGDYRIQVTANGFDQGAYPGVVTAEPYTITSFTTPALYPTSGIEEGAGQLASLRQAELQAWPNPVRKCAVINWMVTQPGHVTVQVLDNAGRVVRTVQDGYMEPGRYTGKWDGTDDTGMRTANGIYFYSLVSASCRSVQKTVLMMH